MVVKLGLILPKEEEKKKRERESQTSERTGIERGGC